MSDLEALPPDLRALFAREREAYPDDDAARARTLRRIEASIAFGAIGIATATAAVKTGLVASALAHATKYAKLWIALSFTTGIVLGETHARLPSPAPGSPVVNAPPRAAATTSSPSPATASVAPSAMPVSSLPAASSPAPAPASAAPSNLAAEQALIDTARSALSRGRSADALRATEEHSRQFPRGRLSEERETMAIQALLLAGRRSDAEARGVRFHKAYPGSLYGNAVDALLVAPEDAGR